MEFIRTIGEKQQTAREENLAKEAEKVITLSDFANTLYIAYKGIPYIQIDDNATPKDIIQQLSIVRNNYINARSESLKKNVLNNANRSKSKGNKNH